MSPDGGITDALLLVEVDSMGDVDQIYVLPFSTLAAGVEYRLVGMDHEGALTKFAQVACVSFTRGTNITMASGEQRPVEDLVVGDRALTRDDTAWSRAWMKLVPRVTQRLSRRGASSENGIRFAARQLVLTCDLVDTPVAGGTIAPNSAWGEVLVLMEADPILANIASLLRAEMDGTPLADWRRAAQALGVPLEVANQIGIGPVADLDSDPQPLSDITFLDFDQSVVFEPQGS
jgi:hypothetical protein